MKIVKNVIIGLLIMALTLTINNSVYASKQLNENDPEYKAIMEYWEWTAEHGADTYENKDTFINDAANKLAEACKNNGIDISRLRDNFSIGAAEWRGGAGQQESTNDIVTVINEAQRKEDNSEVGKEFTPEDANEKTQFQNKIAELRNKENKTDWDWVNLNSLLCEYYRKYGGKYQDEYYYLAQTVAEHLPSGTQSAYDLYRADAEERQEDIQNNEEQDIHGNAPSREGLGSSNSQAGHTVDEIINEADDFINANDGRETINTANLHAASNTLYNILFGIGIAASVIVGVYLGVKFMLSSAEDKAKVKESLIPYIAGCVVVFGAFTIWKLAILLLQTIG